LFNKLIQALEKAGEEAGLYFISSPIIQIVPDDTAAQQQIHIEAKINLEDLDHTTSLEVEAGENSGGAGSSSGQAQAIPANAFVIVNGMDVIPLNRHVLNIGRRPDNQLVIDDPRVSRLHAQLRAIKGRYVIFDLDSTGGTFVNGQRVVQSILFPGDVISLAGLPLVYGQDPSSFGQTQKFDPFSEE
jgi:hypothetical protein